MTIWQKILLGIFGIGTVFAAGLSTSTPADIVLINNLKSTEAVNAVQGYSIIPATLDPSSGDSYHADTIVVWDGSTTPESVGYELTIIRPSDGFVLATGTGMDAPILSHDWQSPTSTVATTTP